VSGALPGQPGWPILLGMPLNLPIASSGPRAPDKQRPRPLPKHVRQMIELMVRGRPDDPDCAPLSFIEAGRLAGIRPDIARKWLDRPEVRSFLRAERAVFRASINASNELALRRVRDESENGMAVCAAVRTLENIATEADAREGRGGAATACGFLIVVPSEYLPKDRSPVVDVTQKPAAAEPLEPSPPLPRPRRFRKG
jgi:hypothetical protein